jgi:DNA-binding response OmpR family regulator/outer membrane protein OmpA-like peptidoglycan-associated protein
MRILVVEHDPALATFLQRGFQAEDYQVDLTQNTEEAKPLLQQKEYGAAVLDVNSTAAEPLDVLRRVRESAPQLPILILTNRSRSEERVQAFNLGADDLLLKPFAFSELSARLRALTRRGPHTPETELRIEDLELSRVERTVKRGGRVIDLTPKEFALLEYLMRNAGQRVTRTEIIQHVWHLSFDTMTNIVDVYINYSSSQIDQHRVGQLSVAIQNAFRQMGVFDSPGAFPIASSSQSSPAAKMRIDEDAERLRKLGSIANAHQAAAVSRPDMTLIQRELESSLAPEINKRMVAVTPTKDGIVVSLRELGFFDSGSAALRPDAESAIAKFIQVVAPLKVRIRIEGHTDNVPIHTAKFDSNWELSTARATEMIKLFISYYGLSPDRLSASGYGEYYPVGSNDTAEGRATNRRVDLVILNSNADSGHPLRTTP